MKHGIYASHYANWALYILLQSLEHLWNRYIIMVLKRWKMRPQRLKTLSYFTNFWVTKDSNSSVSNSYRHVPNIYTLQLTENMLSILNQLQDIWFWSKNTNGRLPYPHFKMRGNISI
jgi:hypothetical protein